MRFPVAITAFVGIVAAVAAATPTAPHVKSHGDMSSNPEHHGVKHQENKAHAVMDLEPRWNLCNDVIQVVTFTKTVTKTSVSTTATIPEWCTGSSMFNPPTSPAKSSEPPKVPVKQSTPWFIPSSTPEIYSMPPLKPTSLPIKPTIPPPSESKPPIYVPPYTPESPVGSSAATKVPPTLNKVVTPATTEQQSTPASGAPTTRKITTSKPSMYSPTYPTETESTTTPSAPNGAGLQVPNMALASVLSLLLYALGLL